MQFMYDLTYDLFKKNIEENGEPSTLYFI